MITYLLKRSFYLLGLTTVIVGLSGFPATAESTNTVVTSSQVTVPDANATTSSTDLQVDPNAPQNSTLTPRLLSSSADQVPLTG
ncbi:hypothetical protein FNW02_16245 [Komarekiella sp. 'clone 1']|uniref:Uncharacterized protein n=1 Tax=Komarekiella delphini-convector SJRDD-AB1 TaxID=2593771 RepID=A0AA40SYE3_9NOST|nr:hypothetical protein [Komarekiella delphini-convector]MBD6617334.1 hypothetical protein [Komarekiella delphini-convector SJRDD-AB1]